MDFLSFSILMQWQIFKKLWYLQINIWYSSGAQNNSYSNNLDNLDKTSGYV